MVTNTANDPSHERVKHTKPSLQINLSISTVLWVLSHLAQWHNVLAFKTSRSAGTSRKYLEKHKHFRDDPLACWYTSGMAGMLAQLKDPWHRQTNDNTPLSQSGKTLLAHTDDVVSLWLIMVYMVMKLMSFLSQSRRETSPHSENWPNPINRK